MEQRKKRRSPFEKVRNAIIANRLNMDEIESGIIFDSLPKEVADILFISERTITTETEISGRNLDILFTIDKQNKPRKI